MYYFAKFCRICIQSGVKLLDIDTLDFDCIKLSEKLEVCAKMVVGRESLSTEICIQCITKLRISYQFQDMCKKSTKILQGYLAELIGTNDKVDPDSFINSELNVTLTPLSPNAIIRNNKRKRITKEQRCSLLKQLLTPNDKLKKERDKCYLQNSSSNYTSGGLRNIINFTRNYEFGWNPEKSQHEPTHLDKLTQFSNNFFQNDFSEFRDTILYIIENKDNLSESGDDEEDDDTDFLQNLNDVKEEDNINEKSIKFEEVIVEPDIKVKREIEFEDENDCPYNFVEATYNELECKNELPDSLNCQSSFQINLPINNNNNYSLSANTENKSSAMQLLDKLVGSYSRAHRKTFSQNSVRCRTRNNPYINPTLKEQFLFRSFKCEKCNRYFKSPGYLKAHNSKVHY